MRDTLSQLAKNYQCFRILLNCVVGQERTITPPQMRSHPDNNNEQIL